MKVLVTGGRDYFNKQEVYDNLDIIHKRIPITKIVTGAATGADSLAVEWAKERQVAYQEYPADWDKYKKAAGHIRNAQMLREEKPHLVLAFPGNNGTKDMIDKAIKAYTKVQMVI